MTQPLGFDIDPCVTLSKARPHSRSALPPLPHGDQVAHGNVGCRADRLGARSLSDGCDPEHCHLGVSVPTPGSILWEDSRVLSHVLSPAGLLQTEQEAFAAEGGSQRTDRET